MIITLILTGLEGTSSDQELTDALMRAAARGGSVDISGQSFYGRHTDALHYFSSIIFFITRFYSVVWAEAILIIATG